MARKNRRSAVAGGTVVALVVGTVVALSLSYEGVATADVQLNDGGVWVTGTGDSRVGRLNYPIQEIDGQFPAASVDFDVIQQGSDVFVVDEALDRVDRVDPTTVLISAGANLPANHQVVLGGGALAVLDRSTGQVHLTPTSNVAALEEEDREPLLTLGAGGVIAVDEAGTLWGFAPETRTLQSLTAEDAATLTEASAPLETDDQGAGEETEVESGEAESPEPDPSDQEELPEPSVIDLTDSIIGGSDADLSQARIELSALGEKPVLLIEREVRADGSNESTAQVEIITPQADPIVLAQALAEQDGDRDLEGTRLQASGASAASVTLATSDALLRLPLDGGDPVIVTADVSGTPSQPVVVAGCAHSAWTSGTGSAAYTRLCQDEPVSLPVPVAGVGADLAFRVNRDVVVLNDMTSGDVWLIQNQLVLVKDWIDTTPPPNAAQEEQDSQDEVQEQVPLERDEANRPPSANDDTLGVRAGTTQLLQVLANDSDPDGDLLTVAGFEGGDPALASLVTVLGGRAIQAVIPQDARGTTTLTYIADDGRGLTDSANLTIRVVPIGENSPPELLREPKIEVAKGASITTNVFSDIRDPDGDELTLVSAVVDNASDSVRVTPDGTLTFADAGVSAGEKRVTLSLFDGYASSELEITVTSLGEGNTPPTAVYDFATAFVGQSIILTPLANDVDPNGEVLRLANVTPFGNGQTTPTYGADGTVEFTPSQAGPTYAVYVIADDQGATSEGLIRVDVQTPTPGDPVAVRDTALLPPGGEVLVDVLHNDSDPSGEVLAVQQVEVPTGRGLQVAVIEHRLLRISSDRVLSGPVRIGYTISNGSSSASGEVLVMPLPAGAQPQPPTAVEDTVSVRAGDYVTIPVLANDHHPNALDFTLDETLEMAPEAGLMFATQGVLRYQAPNKSGQQVAIYRITDVNGQYTSARVVINVTEVGENQAPVPVDVDTRAFQRERIRIPISLIGIDPDGDSVSLLGIGSSPTKGEVVAVGTDYLDYVPFSAAVGTDTFTFTVRDRPGQIGTGQISVGIVPPPDVNRAPSVPAVTAHHRPDRSVIVDVLEQATDPDGDVVTVESIVDDGGLTTEIVDNKLQIQTTVETGIFVITFEASDRNGGVALSTLTLEVSPNAPLHTPVAVDDLVPVSAIIGFTSVDIDVLANDFDPDGAAADLVLDLPEGQEAATVIGRELRVVLAPGRQVVTYRITDLDGRSTYAFVDVPGLEDSGPALRADFGGLEVLTGANLQVELNDHVVTVSGRPVQLTDPDAVVATNSNEASAVVDADTLSFTSATGYVGPATLTFEVTDSEVVDDPERLTSVLTIPITVLPDGNTPPTLASTEIEVEAGVREAQVIRLPPLSDDADGTDRDSLTYELLGQPEGFVAELVGGTDLHVTAALDTQKGTRGEFVVTVSDGVNEPVSATMVAVAVASKQPLISASDDDLGEIVQGQSSTIDVLANDTNPFEGGERIITQVNAETGVSAPSMSGSSVTVTPPNDFVGRLVVVYTVQDATGDPDRAVQARVRANVIGVPAAAASPRVVSVGNRVVTLTWSPPIDNGAPITGYTVRWAGGAQECGSTTCEITGLTNNVEYTFTVAASNKVGVGPDSGASAVARPDVKPGTPGAPGLVFGDSLLEVSWVAPANEGSPISAYDLQISPTTGSGQITLAAVTGHTWTGLNNGTAYQIRVRARNAAPEPSEWSAWSTPEIPAAPPAAPQAPSAAREDTPLGGKVTVTWQPPATNGDPLRDYTLVPYRNGAAQPAITLPPGQTSYSYSAINGSDYTFTVQTQNKAGVSPVSPASASVRSFGKPAQVAAVSATATGSDGQVLIDFAAPGDNGQAISRYEYSVSGGAWAAVPGSRTINGLADGTAVTFQVRACNTYCGDASAASPAVTPYGPIGQPSVAGEKVGTQGVRFTITRPSSGANGRPEAAFQYRVNGGAWQTVPGNGVVNLGDGYAQSFTVQARYAVSGPAAETLSGEVTRTTDDPPPPTPPRIWFTQGPERACDSGGFGCHTFELHWEYFGGATQQTVAINTSGCGGAGWSGYTVVMGGNGTATLTKGGTPPHLGTCTGNSPQAWPTLSNPPAGLVTTNTPWN